MRRHRPQSSVTRRAAGRRPNSPNRMRIEPHRRPRTLTTRGAADRRGVRPAVPTRIGIERVPHVGWAKRPGANASGGVPANQRETFDQENGGYGEDAFAHPTNCPKGGSACRFRRARVNSLRHSQGTVTCSIGCGARSGVLRSNSSGCDGLCRTMPPMRRPTGIRKPNRCATTTRSTGPTFSTSYRSVWKCSAASSPNSTS